MPINGSQTIAGAARLRRESDALLVLIITSDQVVYSADPRLLPRDLEDTLIRKASTIADHMREDRKKGKRV